MKSKTEHIIIRMFFNLNFRYLKSNEPKLENEVEDECENSGTSGDEIWGTPTSGDLDDNISPSFYEGRRCSVGFLLL